MTRPARLVVCFGTATDIGKTYVGAAVLAELARRGQRVSARKPAQSFAPDDPGPTDAAVLGAATGEPAEVVCSPAHWLPVPMAPPMAAEVLGRPSPALADHVSAIAASWPDRRVDVGWVETVGGPRSPIAADGDGIDLAASIGADGLVLVADAALGTVNAVRLAVDALGVLGSPVAVLLNRYDPEVDLHARNLEWLRDRDGYDVVTDVADLADRVSPGPP